MLKDSRDALGWMFVTVGVLTAAGLAVADLLWFGYGGLGFVQTLGLMWGLIVLALGGVLVYRSSSVPDIRLRRFNRVLIGALLVCSLALSWLVFSPTQAREISADQRAWCDSYAPAMYDAAVELELVTLDEVVDLLLNIPQIDPGFITGLPERTRERILGLFETEPELMRLASAAVWTTYGVEPNGEVYEKACKAAQASA